MKLPQHLASTQAMGEKVGEVIAQYEIGNYQNFVYLILDWKEKKAAWIDPQLDLSQPLACLKRHGFELSSILLTHTHFDHIAGVPELVKLYPHVPIRVHQGDLHRLDSSILKSGNIQPVQEGEWLTVGSLRVQALHTPGHSQGEVCYQVDSNPPYLFTGDTVFIRDCGRTDLETGSTEEMFHSLQMLKKLPPETVFLPGHHYQKECSTTLAQELLESPPFRCKTIDELAALP